MENMSKMEQYRMSRTANMANIKEIIGETVTVIAMAEREYVNEDGEVHNVLAMKLADGRYYRTETAAFMEAFRDFWDFFADEAEKPAIKIVGKRSRKGNDFVNFEVVE